VDVFSPASKKQEKAGSPGDVFSPTSKNIGSEIRNQRNSRA